MTQQVRSLFEAIYQRSAANLAGHDLIRFCLFSDRLDKPISICLTRVDELSVEFLLSTISKVLQSKTEIPLDKGFRLDVITVKRPSPGSGRRRVTNLELDCLNKKSIYQLEEDGSGLCCARAISYAMAIKNGDPQLRNIRRKGSDVLRKRGEDLHRAAGVPLGPCGLEEIKIFERHLQVQICVVTPENGNRVCIFSISVTLILSIKLHIF